MKPSITLITWLTAIFIFAAANWYIIVKKKKSPVHWQVVLFAVFVAILHGIYIAKVHTPKNWVPDDYTMAVLSLYAFTWWAFYDGWLNWMRGLDYFYIGKSSDKEEDAGTDKFFENKRPLYIITKVIAFGLSVVSFIIMVQET